MGTYFPEFCQINLKENPVYFILKTTIAGFLRLVVSFFLLEPKFIDDFAAHCFYIMLELLNDLVLVLGLGELISPLSFHSFNLILGVG